MNERYEFDVYFDYACPYVNSAAVWLHHLQGQLGDQLAVKWRYFPLEQVNSPEGPEWKLWEQPDSHRSRGRPAFQAAIAARLQGDEAFGRFHFSLMHLKHDEGKDHGRPATLRAAAEAAELDLDRFERDRVDRAHLPLIGRDYETGRERFGVFGTPTFVFPNGNAAYLKLMPPPPIEDALPFFEEFIRTARDRPYVAEIKRPTAPS